LVRDQGRDRREILQRIERHLRVQVRIDRDQAVLAQQQRVTVGRRLRDQVAGDVAVGARMIVDDDRHGENLGKLLADDACGNIGSAAGWDRHDHLDSPRRILGEHLGARQYQQAGRKQVAQFRRHHAFFRIS
jgi:hypothetical protein